MRLRYATVGVCLAALGCARELEVSPPPYKPVVTVRELMESVIAHAAETYWGSVQVIVDDVHGSIPDKAPTKLTVTLAVRIAP